MAGLPSAALTTGLALVLLIGGLVVGVPLPIVPGPVLLVFSVAGMTLAACLLMSAGEDDARRVTVAQAVLVIALCGLLASFVVSAL